MPIKAQKVITLNCLSLFQIIIYHNLLMGKT